MHFHCGRHAEYRTQHLLPGAGRHVTDDASVHGVEASRELGYMLPGMRTCTTPGLTRQALLIAEAYLASFSKMSLMKEFMMDMTLASTPSPGCPCLGTLKM